MKPNSKDNPRSAEHAEAMRNRILDASELCFIRYGFHAASMAKVAETAEISQGLAYRYFKSKNAIILAIIDRQLSERHTLNEASATADDYVAKVIELVQSWSKEGNTRMNSVLFIEMCAEASRDPEVQTAILKADATYRAEFKKWLTHLSQKSGTVLSDEQIDKRFYALQCLIEGTALITTRQTESSATNEYVLSFLRQIISPDSPF
ncbi:TetR/AcrR family transcriptional regulator [Pelagicoccus albus]|uniref:TetR/AcrR family transcriptional regulator n=1 Tax=Pelagicoccus albus TaxID=415222 RepID=A0A7X1E9I2_9BACT|nr:TetR/AcrR family transcriptional regulator [Pelagicoccus albus]MBC2607356.1 TetR/AcrR family transcriptional regulator [Pelagicoccus albus]